jgi:osmotically-inducible protein OsmY
MTVATVKSDREIQEDVLLELRWDSRVDQTEIGVEVDKGVVTLTGTVNSFAKKLAAKGAAHRVLGVLDVADNVQVKYPGSPKPTDTEVAQAVRHALVWDALVPDKKIHSTVRDGFVTLEGEVETLREREDAERAVRGLSGVAGIFNRLTIKPAKADPAQVRKSIEQALERRAAWEAEGIRVKVEDGAVILEGRVRSWPERTAVIETVNHAPGVREVRDRLTVSPWT